MTRATTIFLAASAVCAIAAPLAAQLRPGVRIADIRTRVPMIERNETIKAPPMQWKVDPNVLKMAPQVVAGNIARHIAANMAGKSVGFAVTVMMPGGQTASATGGMARSAPDGSPRAWTDGDRINVASTSKTITAVAILRAAAAKNIDLGTKAYTLLPADWTYSDSFKTITIAELLNHTSGLRGCRPENQYLKECAAKDWNPADKSPSIDIYTRYDNGNYAYLRWILSRIVDGKTPGEAIAGPRYWAIVNQSVFTPAGMGGADCASGASPALSYVSTKDDQVYNSYVAQNYDFTTVKAGLDWGDDTNRCGSQGWNLSSRQLATFANALWVTHKLLPSATVDQMQADQRGMMYSDFGKGLSAYGHNGYFPPENGGELHSLILSFSNGVSIGMLVNSRYKGNFYWDIANAVRDETK